jgi:integrase
MEKFAESAPKTRNERRGIVKMFFQWAVEQDYLANTHRLLEASRLKHENADVEEIECYSGAELRSMLERCNRAPAPAKDGEEPEADYRDLLPVLALAGLAGLRETEILRLDWRDVWRVPDHIEVGALKAKTRSRRLIEFYASLNQWLEPFRDKSGPIYDQDSKKFHEQFKRLRDDLEIQHRRNGMRHSYISAHYALHSDEGLTAKLAGNSPAMVHRNYKGLLTKKEGEAWFAVAPAQPENVITLAQPPVKK